MRSSVLSALRTMTSGPAQLTLYGLAAGALALSVGAALPPELAVLASSVGANALYDMLKKVAEGQAGEAEGLETQLQRAALELQARNVLDDEAHQRAIGALILETALLKQAVEQTEYATLVAIARQTEGHAALAQALHTDLAYITDYLARILAQQEQQATREQVATLDRRLEDLVDVLNDLVARSEPAGPVHRPVQILWVHGSGAHDPVVDRIRTALLAQGFALLEPAPPSPEPSSDGRTALGRADHVLIILQEPGALSKTARAALDEALTVCLPVTVVGCGDASPQLPPDVGHARRVDFSAGQDESTPLADLIRILSATPAGPGRLRDVPALPPKHLPRPAELAHLQALVLAGRGRTVHTAPRITLLEGMGGIGKSFLAAAFAQACPTRMAFPDGVLWVSVGQQPLLASLYQRIGVALGDHPADYPADEGTCLVRVQNALAGKRCLLIVDDVWDLRTGLAFRDLVVGTQTDVLITTRNLQLREALGAAASRVDLLDEAQAVALLQALSGRADPGHAEVAATLGRLPLALKLAGARMAKEGLTAAAFLARFDRVSRLYTDRRALERKDRQESLSVSILLGIEAVFGPEKTDAALFDALGVFPDDTRVPEETILRLWGRIRPGLADFERHDILLELSDLALIERHTDRSISLHDILHAYTREQLGDRYGETQALLLAAHRPASGWRDLADDEPYFWDHLAYHLTEAGSGAELAQTVVDFLYLARKCRLRSVFAAEADIAAARQLNPASRAVEAMGRRFAQSFGWINRAAQAPDVQATDLAGLLHIQTVHVPELADSRQSLERNATRSFVGGWRPLPDLPDGHLIRTLPGHASRVLGVALNTQRGVIVSASSRGGLVAWSLTGERLRAFSGNPGAVHDVALDSGGRRVYSAAVDGRLRAWDRATGELQLTVSVPRIRALALPEGGDAVYAGAADGLIHLLDAHTGHVRAHIVGHARAILDLACSTDGATLASASADGTVKLWDARTGTLRATLCGHTDHVWSVALDARAFTVVSGSADGSVRVWDGVTGDVRRTLLGHTDEVHAVALSADGGTVISASVDKTLRVWDIETGRCLATLEGHRGPVQSLASGTDNDLVISGSEDGTIKVWDLAGLSDPARRAGAEREPVETPRPPIRDVIAVSAQTGAVVCTTAIGLRDIHRIIPGDPTRDEITTDGYGPFAMSGDGAFVVGYVGHTRATQHSEDATDFIPTLWATGARHSDWGPVWPGSERPGSAALDHSGKVLAAGSSRYAILAWDTGSWAEIFRLETWDVQRRMVCLSPDGTSILTVGESDQIDVWDLASGRLRFTLQGEIHTMCAAVSSDHAHVVSGTTDGSIRVHDGQTGQLLAAWPVAELPIRQVALDPSGQRILCVTGGGYDSPRSDVTLWALSTGACLGTFAADADITCCDWARDGSHFVLGGRNGVYGLQILGKRPAVRFDR